MYSGIGDLSGKSSTEIAIADIFFHVHGDVDRALAFYRVSLAGKQQLSDPRSMGHIWRSMAMIELMKRDIATSISFMVRAVIVDRQTHSSYLEADLHVLASTKALLAEMVAADRTQVVSS